MLSTVYRIRWFLRKFRLGIRKADLVLDVGSGHDPHFRADVICDKFTGDNVERMDRDIRIDRPFVACDAEALPFVDGAFDYVISSHLIEHLEHPDVFLNELMRVGKRGYIEAPSEFSEKLGGLPTHKWFVRVDGGRLVLTQKNRPVFDPVLKEVSLLLGKDMCFKKFALRNPGLFNVTFFWEGKIDYEVNYAPAVSSASDFVKSKIDCNCLEPSSGGRSLGLFEEAKIFLKRSLHLLYRRRNVNLFDVLSCPVCKKKVATSGGAVLCAHCRKSYPLKNGIPVMLAESARAVPPA